MMPLDDLVVALHGACRQAGAAILALRGGDPEASLKPDGSPVSAADQAASRILREALDTLAPGIPVVCEEGDQDPGAAPRFWMVDPLDGTREFLRGTSRFTVNVALVDGGRPVLGVVLAPVDGLCWWGGRALGAFRDGRPIRVRALVEPPRVLLSPGESAQATGTLPARVLARWPGAECVPMPGAFKFCELAEGRADLYPRSVPSCGWDSAAGQAILEGAGGAVLDDRGETLAYVPSVGWRNSPFLAVADAGADWRWLFAG
jgi:3'(2'), 5'-bisphosphate nucleotidase